MTNANGFAAIRAIEYYLPAQVVTNEELARRYSEWTAERIEEKLGIVTRHIAAEDECASDLGVRAAQRLFDSGACRREEIDYLLFCTQSPDYFLPTTACTMQTRLGLLKCLGALDFNLGCSGFVYGLGLAKGLIETGQARNVLLITAETYSKYMHPDDKSVRTLFGDAGAATLVAAINQAPLGDRPWIGPFCYGTDGSGAMQLAVEAGACRKRHSTGEVTFDANGNPRHDGSLFMNGPEIMTFSLSVVDAVLKELLHKAGFALADVDLFIFHQANKYMLDTLRRKCKIPADRFIMHLRETGNTVSCTIPIALKEAELSGRMTPGSTVMVVGFGVGLSWGAGLLQWA
jgi:3-oxoacyl-[acyl-carrier-protein] synthase III